MRTIQFTHEDDSGNEITLDIFYTIYPYRKKDDSVLDNDEGGLLIHEIKQDGIVVEVSEEVMLEIHEFIHENDEDDLDKEYYFDEEN